ncbi:hypothetical protein [Candidatus Nanohalobium constans]|uniref:ATP-dependent RNA helicase DeaD n=1 Tax=Candidatus Nanohalobium constans TaxID=2565781 RepID=A0A5Q0UEQ6_9ARCH|nr:hypothetical protein [Candidatus Nanohalobium constans]QGA80062.1 ATP-dependent RNA helicase DeaD [Candidatus Nanohalobium constans]
MGFENDIKLKRFRNAHSDSLEDVREFLDSYEEDYISHKELINYIRDDSNATIASAAGIIDVLKIDEYLEGSSIEGYEVKL